jgi:hypothetical protein
MFRKKKPHTDHQHSNSHSHPSHHDKKSAKKHGRKKVGLFYKVSISLLVIFSLILLYFMILVSTKPKSIPYVTQKIELAVKERFGNDSSLENTYLSLTRYGTLNVRIANLKVFYQLPEAGTKQEFLIPRLEAEFSLFNLILLRFHPSKIKVINPEIVIDNLQKLQQQSDQKNIAQTKELLPLILVLSSMRDEDFPIKNFEIENAKLLVKGEKINTEILIKKSLIHAKVKGKTLQITSSNKFNFDVKKEDVDFGVNCQLSERNDFKCDLLLENFVANSIAGLHQGLSRLDNVNATVNASASFEVQNGEMGNLFFKADSRKGSFEFLDFFNQEMNFTDLSLEGEYDKKLGILNLSEIKTDFLIDEKNQTNGLSKAHFLMSLLVSDLNNSQGKRLDFYIRLQNAPNNEMEKFWPSALHEHGIREWVIDHIKNGVIENAYAKFSIIKDESGSNLTNINSGIVFSGFDLEYSEEFPTISDISGTASFNKNSMKIAIARGDVLDSKISDGLVTIDDFNAPVSVLKISGKSIGHAADSLSHVDRAPSFRDEVKKYLNGDSVNDFDIRIPLHETINLKDIYIAANSVVSGLGNDYLKGGIIVSSKKDFGSTNFVTNIDLTAAELKVKALDIEKQSDVEGGLNFTVSVANPKKIRLQNISLWKKDVKKSVAKQSPTTAKISGAIEFETSPFSLTFVDFKNDNFGKNNYAFSYIADKKNSLQKVILKGQKVNLAPLIEGKFFDSPQNKNFANSQIKVESKNLLLLNGKSIKDFSLFTSCRNNFCYNGFLSGNYGKQQSLNLRSSKKTRDQKDKAEIFVNIDGRITDVGYLAEAFGISNVISSGDAKVSLRNKIVNKKQVLEGEVVIDNDITIYENAAVKKLAKNNLFSQVRDKIFSNDKTTFDSVKLKFDIQDNILNINSLIANNYKIGITAKGFVDLKNYNCEIKGMIVPGFIVNNLFGIGKIPLIGGVISGLLTGGEGGGLFGIRYEYVKKPNDKEAKFETSKVSSFVPTTIKNLFDLI